MGGATMRAHLLGCVAALVLVISVMADTGATAMKFYVFTEKCYENYFVNFDFFDISCFKSTINKALSYAIIGGAFALKLPQMHNIYKDSSVAGLNGISLYMDVASFLPAPIYNILNNNAFSTYGEALVVLVENVILVSRLPSFIPCRATDPLKMLTP